MIDTRKLNKRITDLKWGPQSCDLNPSLDFDAKISMKMETHPHKAHYCVRGSSVTTSQA